VKNKLGNINPDFLNPRNSRNPRLCLLLFLLFPFFISAQNDTRAKIDLERRNLQYDDEKTFEKANEFIHEDSAYYIGYMYKGGFQFYRADDELGFSQVIVPLSNAMRLIEKDYDKELRTRSNDIFTYLRVSNYQNDYTTIAYWLEQAYQNIEDPGKAMEVLKHVRDRNIQFEQGLETYNTMAWIYHRNRMFTPSASPKYSFLKNSVKENDSMAFMYLDSALIKIRNDASVNTGLYDPTYLNRQYLFTYHYKAILFDFNLEIDSANYYYDELIRTGYYSSNNYAEFKMAMGEFETADQFFHEAELREGGGGEKRTKEYFYMRGTLDEYRGHPEDADTLLRKVLDEQGSTPGFGWHAIALARAQHYEGLTSESQKMANKAYNFQELHIATTWGQEQYDLAVATLNYTNSVQFEKEYRFENNQWSFWFNPKNWYTTADYTRKVSENKLQLQVLMANNPERAQVIYPIFSSENLINFDEVNSAIDGFGNEFFIKIYKKLEETDKRPKIKKYFRYFIGKLYLSEGDKSSAINYFEQVLNDPETSDPYNTLLYARCCEGMALATSSASEKEYWTQKMYTAFPQLVALSDLKMKFNLEVSGVPAGGDPFLIIGWGWIFRIIGIGLTLFLFVYNFYKKKRWHYVIILLPLAICLVLGYFGDGFDEDRVCNLNPSKAIFNGLKNTNIDFGSIKDPATDAMNFSPDKINLSVIQDPPTVHLTFGDEKDATIIDYTVTLPYTDSTITQGSLRVPKDETKDGGKLLAYRLFGIRKKEIGDQPDPIAQPKKGDKKKGI
jgi:tetratricopeptide (TPR) repeat protein